MDSNTLKCGVKENRTPESNYFYTGVIIYLTTRNQGYILETMINQTEMNLAMTRQQPAIPNTVSFRGAKLARIVTSGSPLNDRRNPGWRPACLMGSKGGESYISRVRMTVGIIAKTWACPDREGQYCHKRLSRNGKRPSEATPGPHKFNRRRVQKCRERERKALRRSTNLMVNLMYNQDVA